jgi:hypothetical protein
MTGLNVNGSGVGADATAGEGAKAGAGARAVAVPPATGEIGERSTSMDGALGARA